VEGSVPLSLDAVDKLWKMLVGYVVCSNLSVQRNTGLTAPRQLEASYLHFQDLHCFLQVSHCDFSMTSIQMLHRSCSNLVYSRLAAQL